MRRFAHGWLLAALTCLLTATVWGTDYKLMDGSTITGQIAEGDDFGVVFRLQTGGFSKRVPYSKLSQDALNALMNDPKVDTRLKVLADPFLDIPPDSIPPHKPQRPVVLREPPRVERPLGRTTLFSSSTSPLGLAILGILYLANLLAAYEIALYRNRPIAFVCGLSALLPILGPAIFLVSPTLEREGDGATGAEGTPSPAQTATGAPAGATSRHIGAGGVATPAAGTGLRMVAAQEKGPSGKAEAKTYKRGDYTFNRRFIETQFTGFFRVVPSEAEKDLVLVVTTAKQGFVGRRISRISSNEFFLVLLQGGGKEVAIGFGEIAQIAVKHKDDVRD